MHTGATQTIRNIEAIGLRPVAYRTDDQLPGGSLPSDWSPWPVSLIKVVAEDFTGIGSAYTDVRLVRAALSVTEPLYHHESALEPTRVSDKLLNHAAWMGRGGAVEHTVSGINIALWDILGQVTRQPIGRLLGGRYRERVLAYASIIADDPGRMNERLAELRDCGFRAFKIGWGDLACGPQGRQELMIRAAREVVGSESELMVDVGGSGPFFPHQYSCALRLSRIAAGYGVAWLEEPLPPEALDDYRRLRDSSPTPIAAGEALVGRHAFRSYIEGGALDVVQPDVSKVGGISEQRRIAESAEDHGLRYVGHGSYTAVGVAADLQLASALKGATLVEFEVDSPHLSIVAERFKLDADGMLSVPEAPGLGMTIDSEAIERAAFEPV